jgi:hypothetical protein
MRIELASFSFFVHILLDLTLILEVVMLFAKETSKRDVLIVHHLSMFSPLRNKNNIL